MAKLTPAQMKKAVEEFKKKFTPGFYHGSPNPNITAFDPLKSTVRDVDFVTPGVTFVTKSPKFADSFTAGKGPYISLKTGEAIPLGSYNKGSTMYPVSVDMSNHFDPTTPEGRLLIEAYVAKKYADDPKMARQFKSRIEDPHSNWTTMESPAFLQHLRDSGIKTFDVNESGYQNVGVLDPSKIRGKFAKYNPEEAESPEFMKAEGGPVGYAPGGKVGALTALSQRLGKPTLDLLNKSPEELLAARQAMTGFVQKQNATLAQAVDAYRLGKISHDELQDIIAKTYKPNILGKVPDRLSPYDIAVAIGPGKAKKGIVDFNVEIPKGATYDTRLDIPGYEATGQNVGSIVLPSGKTVYGQAEHLGNVSFQSDPTKSMRVALGTKEQALTPGAAEYGMAKSPFAVVRGTHLGTDPEEIRRMMEFYTGAPEWKEIGMNPYARSQFLHKKSMKPAWQSDEVLKYGNYVLAKDPELTDWLDPRLAVDVEKVGGVPGLKFASGGKVNAAVELAKKIAPKFNLEAIKNMPVSSAQKQTPVARAFEMLSSENVDPKVKQQIFKQYLQTHPDLVKKSGATTYDELTQAAYQQMAKETAGQFQALQGSGVKLSFDPTGEKAYKSSKEMLEDALQNKHLTVFQGGEPHPALGREANEQFRAVHDYFGHGTTGASFGPKGEELAYGAHSQMYSPLARLAAATETRGQNSLVSYSGMNEELINAMNQLKTQREQLIKSGGDPSIINDQLVKLGQQFKYAPQKPLILPPEQIDINYQGFAAGGAAKKVLEHARSLPFVHFSNAPSISQLDPRMYGKGIKGAEADRLKEALDIKPRSYFYVDKPGVKPEQGLGPHKYQGTAEGIYPLHEDPLGLSAIAKQKSLDPYLMSQGISQVDEKQQLNELERLIKQAGYKGYANDDVGLLFYPTPVKKAVEGKAGGGSVFNPEGADYDYQTAMAYGMGPTGTGEDLGHWGSVAPTSDDERMLRDLPKDAYVMLKGKAHETFDKAEAAEKERGSKIVKIGDRYYSIPK